MFGRSPSPTRSDLVAQATRARSRGRKKKALALYEQALECEGTRYDIHARMAPLLAETRQYDRAKRSFQIAATGFHTQGFLQKAESVWLQAAQHLPQTRSVWENLSKTRVEQNKVIDARLVLVQGSKHFRKKRDRGEAIVLLRSAFDLEPYDYDVTLDLARLLATTEERPKAIELLAELAPRCAGKRLRRIRASQFRLAPSVKTAWRWLRAWFA